MKQFVQDYWAESRRRRLGKPSYPHRTNRRGLLFFGGKFSPFCVLFLEGGGLTPPKPCDSLSELTGFAVT